MMSVSRLTQKWITKLFYSHNPTHNSKPRHTTRTFPHPVRPPYTLMYSWVVIALIHIWNRRRPKGRTKAAQRNGCFRIRTAAPVPEGVCVKVCVFRSASMRNVYIISILCVLHKCTIVLARAFSLFLALHFAIVALRVACRKTHTAYMHDVGALNIKEQKESERESASPRTQPIYHMHGIYAAQTVSQQQQQRITELFSGV